MKYIEFIFYIFERYWSVSDCNLFYINLSHIIPAAGLTVDFISSSGIQWLPNVGPKGHETINQEKK